MALSNLKTFVPYYVLFFFAVLFSSAPAWGNSVSGNFSSVSGTVIVLNLNIHSPSLTALIIEQHLSPGNSITSTSPKAIKVNSENGNVKWLLKKVRKNTITLKTTLKSPLKGKVRAIVRYNSPQSGKMIEFRIDS